MKNNKGFTLTELLSVIVILGVIMTIAVPSYTGMIQNSKRKAFVVEAQNYVSAVSAGITQGTYKAPSASNDMTVVNINMIELKDGDYISPYGNEWVDQKSYVAVINVGTSLDPEYKYYFAAQDTKRNAIPLTEINKITTDSITNEARNTMEVTVQSLAGNISGYEAEKAIISGIENVKDENGNILDWNVTTYTK